MKIKKLITVISAVCLLLTAFAVPSAGAIDGKLVTSGAMLEIYSGDRITETQNLGSVAEAWSNAMAKANNYTETVITMGSDWEMDQLLTVKENCHITLDLNGHYINRKRNGEIIRSGGVFHLEEKSVFTLRDSNPKSKGFDGVKGGVIAGGASTNYGGGVYTEDAAQFRMQGGTIYNCKSSYAGGAVCVDGSSMDTKFIMTGGRIYGCQTVDSVDNCPGGGVYLYKGVVDISNAKIDNCYSEDDGGAIYSERGEIYLKNVIFAGNRAHEMGGAIYLAHDTTKLQATYLNAQGCIFASNHSDEEGGAVFIRDNPTENRATVFHDCKFRNNSAKKDGGAIYVDDDNVGLSQCEIVGNLTEGSGGGVYVDGRYWVTLKGLTVIKDNISDKSKGVADVALESRTLGTARIMNAGLYDGSVVYVGSTSGSTQRISEWISQYQAKYFKTYDGNISERDSRTVQATMVSTGSIFSNGGLTAILIIGGLGVVGIIILIIYKKKKTKTNTNNATEGGEENDDIN